MNAEFFCLLAQILTGDAQISASDDNSHTKKCRIDNTFYLTFCNKNNNPVYISPKTNKKL